MISPRYPSHDFSHPRGRLRFGQVVQVTSLHLVQLPLWLLLSRRGSCLKMGLLALTFVDDIWGVP